MIENYNRYKILQVFFDKPLKNHQIREISRITNISLPSVINHLKELKKLKLIVEDNTGIYPSLKGNRDNYLFKTLKVNDILLKIKKSKILDYIYEKTYTNTIILYGSCSLGEDTQKSDIDLFIESKYKNLDLSQFEQILNRKISVLFEENFKNLSPELKNNIINGIILKGYLKVF
jgi:predicted nucleotidyltransferase